MKEVKEKPILLAHGDGGALTHQLVQDLFLQHFKHEALQAQNDGALLKALSGPPVLSTDSFVISPYFFPGGDIGKLAVAGTVNDIAVTGAIPLYLTVAFILEEGLPISDLEKIVASLAKTAEEAGVAIVAGDTKVVERGHGDGIYINTTGLGYMPAERHLGYHQIQAGDKIIINGTIGDHGLSILSTRAGIAFDTELSSDCAPLNHLIEAILQSCPGAVKFMRDPTRGGVATTAKEIALASEKDLILDEEALPIGETVAGAAEFLGLDPLYMANEGKVIIIVDGERAEEVLATMRELPHGHNSAVIGKVEEKKSHKGQLYVKTHFGSHRILDMIAGDPLPRIC
ncbi:hydrogenase expression/formation protein HypE [Heliorestis convoluta]|uniref:Hydrogenase expression/formation protein HypE n=1 Tax=Heliorestis convoluta TaxID=356322 RepID=A0A5Q2N2F8_9FIRM|nr:hydrogenase expression/formation protein HypE [Heliorestis convoluta]QGG48461.1 hydrogenase expression/formation protein HypE [Heliorestis convoluta]